MSPDKKKIEFITAMIGAFAHQSQLTRQQAYRYIQRFQGIVPTPHLIIYFSATPRYTPHLPYRW